MGRIQVGEEWLYPHIYLPIGQEAQWGDDIVGIAGNGSILHTGPDKLTGRLAFSQTAISGRLGRAPSHPIYEELYCQEYSGNWNVAS